MQQALLGRVFAPQAASALIPLSAQSRKGKRPLSALGIFEPMRQVLLCTVGSSKVNSFCKNPTLSGPEIEQILPVCIRFTFQLLFFRNPGTAVEEGFPVEGFGKTVSEGKATWQPDKAHFTRRISPYFSRSDESVLS
ncbi:hypothetical protein [Larkinella harenae]